MLIRNASRAVRQVGLVTRQLAAMSGSGAFARNRESNALQHQWTELLSTFLGMPARTIGRIGGGRTKPTGLVDVAVIQSLVRSGLVDDLVSNYGHLIVDECHHLSAQSFEQVARQAKAKFVTGLSATVTRKDGQHPIIFMECGPVRYRVSVRHGVATHPFEHRVVVRPTGFRPLRPADPDVRVQFHKLYGRTDCR